MRTTVLVVYLAAAVAAAALATICWRRRGRAPAATGLCVTQLGVLWWALGDANIAGSFLVDAPPSVRQTAGAWVVSGTGVVTLGVFLLFHWLGDPSGAPSRRGLIAVAADPIIMVAGAATNPWWRLVIDSPGRATSSWYAWTPGILFWPHVCYASIVLIVCSYRLLRAIRYGSPVHGRQVTSLITAGAIIVGGGVISTLLSSDRTLPDITPLCFLISAFVVAHALFRQGLLTVVPVARGLVMDRLSDAVIVLDPAGRILDINPTGTALVRRLAPDLPDDLIGIPARRLVDGRPVPESATGEYRTMIDGEQVVLDLRRETMRDRTGRRIASIVVVRDITDVVRQRNELTAANARLYSQHTRISEANRQLLEQVATIEALRVELTEQAVRDDLTGLHNRRHLMTCLERDLRAAREAGTDLCVVLLDLDHFKAVNDTYGHDVGDAVLTLTAQALAETVRDTDTLARYGGEEFVILLSGTDLDRAAARAELIRKRCAAVTVTTPLGPVSPTVSLGVASRRHLLVDDGPHLLKAADEALYRAKAQGRNQVALAALSPAAS